MRDSVRPEPVEGPPGSIQPFREGRNPDRQRATVRLSLSKPVLRAHEGALRHHQPPRVPHSPHRRTGESRYPGQGPGAGASPPLLLPTPAIVVPAKAGIQSAPGGGTPPPTHIAGPLRTLSVRPEPVEGPSATTSPRASRTPPTVVPAKAGIQGRARRGGVSASPTSPHPPSSYRRKPVSRGAPGGSTPPPTHIAGALRTLSVRPEPVEGPSTTKRSPLPPHPDTTPSRDPPSPRYPVPMHHARKQTGHKPTTPRMPQQPAQKELEIPQNPLVLDKTSRICRGQFRRRLVSQPAKGPLNRIKVSTAEEPPCGREPPHDEICNKPETHRRRRRATLNAT